MSFVWDFSVSKVENDQQARIFAKKIRALLFRRLFHKRKRGVFGLNRIAANHNFEITRLSDPL